MTPKEARDRTLGYLVQTLLPFWVERSPDPEYGGFLTYFDRHGRPTGNTTKTFLMQIRMLFTMAGAHRADYGGGRCAELAEMGARFIQDHYWDEEESGWIWIADRQGRPIVRDKVGYGQCFALYTFSEYALATGDPAGRDAADRTFATIFSKMADHDRGGIFELMQPDWRLAAPGAGGGDRKSFDVHMHLMEALTTYFELTGEPAHREKLVESIRILVERMLHPEYKLGWLQFSLDFEPRPAIIYDVQWGRDAHPEDGSARPLDFTSYGHNLEFAWLLLHACNVAGIDRSEFEPILKSIFDHSVEFGIDHQLGGLFVEGPMDGPTTLTEKQFWQQAEAMVGFLDAYTLFGHEVYWDAFEDIYDFVLTNFVAWDAGGEWYERLSREGYPIDDALGHEWKISYHTVRSMIRVVERLDRILDASTNDGMVAPTERQ